MKHTLLVPIAGDGRRFTIEGFLHPKPLIKIPDGRTLVQYGLSSIEEDSYDELIFIIQEKHDKDFSLKEKLLEFWPQAKIVTTKEKTRGTVESCLLAKDLINKEKPLAIYCPDVWFSPKFALSLDMYRDSAGFLLTFKANSSQYSYAKISPGGLVDETREKEVISEQAAVGLYCFRDGSQFIKYAERMIELDIRTNNEFYLCPLYNLLIKDNLTVQSQEVEKMYVLGTPEEYDFIVRNVLEREEGSHIGLVSDHSGFKLKEQFRLWLEENQISYHDWGCKNSEPCDYPNYAWHGVMDIERHEGASIVFGFCRSGQGMNIAAQRELAGCYNSSRFSALIWNEWMAEHAVRHNSARFFAVPSQFVDLDMLVKMLKVIKDATFDGGRHQSRLMSV